MATTAAENETPISHGRGETSREGTVEPVGGKPENHVVTASRVTAAPNDHATCPTFSDGFRGDPT